MDPVLLALTLEGSAEIAKNVAALAGCLVTIVMVYRIPAINGILRFLGRRLISEPLGSWAQKQVAEVVEHRLQASTLWLSEGQAGVAAELEKVGQRLDNIDTKTRQLQPNGGRSIYDRIEQIEGHLQLTPGGALKGLPAAPADPEA